MILGFLDGEHVGNCSLMGNRWMRYRHRATVAIALYQKYTGQGIGTIMMKRLMDAAREQGIEQLELDVLRGLLPARRSMARDIRGVPNRRDDFIARRPASAKAKNLRATPAAVLQRGCRHS